MTHGKADDESVYSAREVMDTVSEMSKLLETGLDSETLAIAVKLCELGVNPEALASVIQELRREMAAYNAGGGDSKT
ncbi:mitotic-spindle organizing protein 1-like [Acanthaster planci]|uniref:Mitotic-spindle organizing protein 1-like n=1 Tax=Acanthaster planci TaxID=133434 RepID=A0A8B7Y0M1_ACAPL|nr:mitotic-spindle organizing protein 1-like [Acanthaster planci]